VSFTGNLASYVQSVAFSDDKIKVKPTMSEQKQVRSVRTDARGAAINYLVFPQKYNLVGYGAASPEFSPSGL
jgi:hypothetical protein